MPNLLFVLLVVVLTASPAPVRADDAEAALPTDPTLAALIAESLAARPELQRAAALVDAETARAPQVGALPDPVIRFGWQNDGFTSIELGRMEGSYVSVMVAQTLPQRA